LLAYRLDFFCVAIPAKIVKEVGFLDEDFGRGYYEDLDYSLRVKQAGYRLGVAEDTFVFHRGSTSFGKVPKETKALIKRNKRIVLSKHGKKIDIPHRRIANLSLLSQYQSKRLAGENVSEYRISNRLQHAKDGLPKSWFKRWRYLRSLRRLEEQLSSQK
jgi:GT2 family glycosyltransferase